MVETRPEEKEMLSVKKPYQTPRLTIHGDVESITQGDEFGESMDAAFTTSIVGRKGRKKLNFS